MSSEVAETPAAAALSLASLKIASPAWQAASMAMDGSIELGPVSAAMRDNSTAWMNTIGILFSAAMPSARLTAVLEGSDPSTGTTILLNIRSLLDPYHSSGPRINYEPVVKEAGGLIHRAFTSRSCGCPA